MYNSIDIAFNGVQYVWLGISIFLLFLLLLSRTDIFRNALVSQKYTKKEYFIFTSLFTILGLCGTYWNFPTPGGIMTFRAVAIILSGFIGGPIVGSITGLIVGINRMFILQTSTASISGSLSILQGIVAGFVSYYIKRQPENKWMWALLYSILIEIGYWTFYALLTWPYAYTNTFEFLALFLPIIITNIPAIALFMQVLESSAKNQDSKKTATTKTLFDSINRLIKTIQNKSDGLDLSNIPSVIISALPNLIWAAIIVNDRVFISTNYKLPKHRNQGNSETAILHLQKSLPSMHHLSQIRLSEKDKEICHILISNPSDLPLSKTDKEFLNGTARIIQLITAYSELKKEKFLLQEAEIRALQSQINPHFLYNTLNTINFYVHHNPDSAVKLIKYLSDYFRHSLNDPSNLISLSEEIHVINCYIEIQKARFGERINVDYHFPKNTITILQIPPLLLQPLVENSVIHGILKKSGGGKIKIGLIPHKKYNKIYVIDNGIGIPHQKMKSLLIDRKSRNHIGLINVHQRLISIYGEKSGLHILSKENHGTIVFANIPNNPYRQTNEEVSW